MADLPEEEFKVQEVKIVEEPERAPMFESVRCSNCGELVMATRVVYVDGKPLCLACANRDALAVVGRGIVANFRPFWRVM